MADAKSSILRPAQFLEAVRKGKRFDVLLLKGTEEFLLRSALKTFLAAVVKPEAEAFDFMELRSQEVDGETLWNALTTLPLLAEKRIVVLELTGEPKAATGEALKAYLSRPSSTTTLVLILIVENKNDLSGVTWPPAVTQVEFLELGERERLAWARQYLTEIGKKMGEDALEYLIDTSSKSLADIAAKINHAAMFIGSDPEINVQVLQQVSGVTSEYTVFQLEDAILRQNGGEAHRAARSLLEGGEELLRLLANNRRTVVKLWKVHRASRKGSAWLNSDEAERFWGSLFGRQSFKIESFKQAACAIGEARLHAAVQGLLDVELRAKTGFDKPARYYEWLWNISTANDSRSEPST
jgi:DNA polymerase III subunit delta